MYGVVIVLLCLSVITLSAEERKRAKDDPKKPNYIPDDYIQIEKGDFKTYLEWWAIKSDNTRDVWRTRHRKRSVRIESFLPSTWNESKYNQIFPVYDEDRYVLFKSSTLMKNNEENYGLCLPNEVHTIPNYITMKSGSNPSLNEYAFLCREWLILNKTHVLDTLRLFGKQKEKKYTVLEDSLVQKISSVSGDSCFRDEIVKELDMCFDKSHYCVMDYGSKNPKLVISDEHVIEVHKEAQVIMRMFNSSEYQNAAYYVIKYGSDYYYFPDTLKTSFEYKWYEKEDFRFSLFPILNPKDLFFKLKPGQSHHSESKIIPDHHSTSNSDFVDGISIYIVNSTFHFKNVGPELKRFIGLK